MNSLLLIVLVAIAVLSQALASSHSHKKTASVSSSSSSSLRSSDSKYAKDAKATVAKFQKALSPYMSKGSATKKVAAAKPSSKKMDLKAADDMIQSGWVEMRMRTKDGCKGKTPMVMGVRLGCTQTTVYPPDSVPFTGGVNVNAHSDSSFVYATMNMHTDSMCSPMSYADSQTITMPKCDNSGSNMGAYLNWNATKDFHNYNGIVKL